MSDARSNGYIFGLSKPLKVMVSAITLVAFLFNTVAVDLAWAAIPRRGQPSNTSLARGGTEQGRGTRTPLELTSVGSDRAGGSAILKDLSVENFTIPQSLGTIKYSHDSKLTTDNERRTTIIHVQDAHCNYYAQHKIAEIIEYLNREYGISEVNLEGGAKEYDLSLFDNIRGKGQGARVQGKELVEKVSDYFVKEGLVNGAEYFAINNPGKINLWGIEDVDLYIANLKAYRSSLAHKDEIDKSMKSLQFILSNLKTKIYTKELLDFDMKYSAYKAGNLEFKDYISYLVAAAKAGAIDIKYFTNIYLLNQTLGEESKIDFKKANNERDDLIDKLTRKLSKNAMQELVVKTVEFKAEKSSVKEFYGYLSAKAKTVNLSLDDYKELKKYIVYISIYDAMDKMKMMDEVSDLENKIKDSLCQNDEQRELNRLSKNLALLKNIFNISLTKEDYNYYRANKDSFDVRNYISFITKKAPFYKITVALDKEIVNLDQYREGMEKFYEYSLERDNAFIKNIKFKRQGARGQGQESRTAIIVTGGFHTENLGDLFRKNNISYISIVPNFKSCDGYECPYFKLLSGEKKVDINQTFSSALKSTLAIPDVWSVGIRGAGILAPATKPALAKSTGEEKTPPVIAPELAGYKGEFVEVLLDGTIQVNRAGLRKAIENSGTIVSEELLDQMSTVIVRHELAEARALREGKDKKPAHAEGMMAEAEALVQTTEGVRSAMHKLWDKLNRGTNATEGQDAWGNGQEGYDGEGVVNARSQILQQAEALLKSGETQKAEDLLLGLLGEGAIEYFANRRQESLVGGSVLAVETGDLLLLAKCGLDKLFSNFCYHPHLLLPLRQHASHIEHMGKFAKDYFRALYDSSLEISQQQFQSDLFYKSELLNEKVIVLISDIAQLYPRSNIGKENSQERDLTIYKLLKIITGAGYSYQSDLQGLNFILQHKEEFINLGPQALSLYINYAFSDNVFRNREDMSEEEYVDPLLTPEALNALIKAKGDIELFENYLRLFSLNQDAPLILQQESLLNNFFKLERANQTSFAIYIYNNKKDSFSLPVLRILFGLNIINLYQSFGPVLNPLLKLIQIFPEEASIYTKAQFINNLSHLSAIGVGEAYADALIILGEQRGMLMTADMQSVIISMAEKDSAAAKDYLLLANNAVEYIEQKEAGITRIVRTGKTYTAITDPLFIRAFLKIKPEIRKSYVKAATEWRLIPQGRLFSFEAAEVIAAINSEVSIGILLERLKDNADFDFKRILDNNALRVRLIALLSDPENNQQTLLEHASPSLLSNSGAPALIGRIKAQIKDRELREAICSIVSSRNDFAEYISNEENFKFLLQVAGRSKLLTQAYIHLLGYIKISDLSKFMQNYKQILIEENINLAIELMELMHTCPDLIGAIDIEKIKALFQLSPPIGQSYMIAASVNPAILQSQELYDLIIMLAKEDIAKGRDIPKEGRIPRDYGHANGLVMLVTKGKNSLPCGYELAAIILKAAQARIGIIEGFKRNLDTLRKINPDILEYIGYSFSHYDEKSETTTHLPWEDNPVVKDYVLRALARFSSEQLGIFFINMVRYYAYNADLDDAEKNKMEILMHTILTDEDTLSKLALCSEGRINAVVNWERDIELGKRDGWTSKRTLRLYNFISPDIIIDLLTGRLNDEAVSDLLVNRDGAIEERAFLENLFSRKFIDNLEKLQTSIGNRVVKLIVNMAQANKNNINVFIRDNYVDELLKNIDSIFGEDGRKNFDRSANSILIMLLSHHPEKLQSYMQTFKRLLGEDILAQFLQGEEYSVIAAWIKLLDDIETAKQIEQLLSHLQGTKQEQRIEYLNFLASINKGFRDIVLNHQVAIVQDWQGNFRVFANLDRVYRDLFALFAHMKIDVGILDEFIGIVIDSGQRHSVKEIEALATGMQQALDLDLSADFIKFLQNFLTQIKSLQQQNNKKGFQKSFSQYITVLGILGQLLQIRKSIMSIGVLQTISQRIIALVTLTLNNPNADRNELEKEYQAILTELIFHVTGERKIPEVLIKNINYFNKILILIRLYFSPNLEKARSYDESAGTWLKRLLTQFMQTGNATALRKIILNIDSNKAERKRLEDKGYNPDLFDYGMEVVKEVYVGADQVKKAKEYIKKQSIGLIEIAQEIGFCPVGMTKAEIEDLAQNGFETYQEAYEFNEAMRRALPNHSYIQQAEQKLEIIRKAEEGAKKIIYSGTKERVRIVISKDPLDEATIGGMKGAGCYSVGDFNEYMPFADALQINRFFARAYDELGRLIGAVELALTDDGVMVYTGKYTSRPELNLDEVWLEAWKALAQWSPAIILSYDSSAGWSEAKKDLSFERIGKDKPVKVINRHTLWMSKYEDAGREVAASSKDGVTYTINAGIIIRGRDCPDVKVSRAVSAPEDIKGADRPKDEIKRAPRSSQIDWAAFQDRLKEAKLYKYLRVIKILQTQQIDLGTLNSDQLENIIRPSMQDVHRNDVDKIFAIIKDLLQSTESHDQPQDKFTIQLLDPSQIDDELISAIRELQRKEYSGLDVWDSVLIREMLDSPSHISILVRDSRGKLVGYLVGITFKEAEERERNMRDDTAQLKEEYLAGANEQAIYAEDLLIDPQFRGSRALLKNLFVNFVLEAHKRNYTTLFMHARVENGLNEIVKKIFGATALGESKASGYQGERTELLRMDLNSPRINGLISVANAQAVGRTKPDQGYFGTGSEVRNGDMERLAGPADMVMKSLEPGGITINMPVSANTMSYTIGGYTVKVNVVDNENSPLAEFSERGKVVTINIRELDSMLKKLGAEGNAHARNGFLVHELTEALAIQMDLNPTEAHTAALMAEAYFVQENKEARNALAELWKEREEKYGAWGERAPPYKSLITDQDRLGKVDAVIADFDGVDKSHKLSVVSLETITAKTGLSNSGVYNITITGEQDGMFVEKYGGLKRAGSQSVNTPYIALRYSGAIGHSINPNGELVEIPGFKESALGGKSAVESLKKIAEECLVDVAKEAGIEDSIVKKIKILGTSRGVTIYVEDDPAIQTVRHDIARLIRTRIKEMQSRNEISGNVEVVASVGGVDIIATSKGAAAIQMIKLLKLKSVVLLADAVGTEENPGNDRSLLSLTAEDLKKAGIDWDVDLIKVYVGSEKDADIPYGVYVAPQAEETRPALDVYNAVINAKSPAQAGSEGEIIAGVDNNYIGRVINLKDLELFGGFEGIRFGPNGSYTINDKSQIVFGDTAVDVRFTYKEIRDREGNVIDEDGFIVKDSTGKFYMIIRAGPADKVTETLLHETTAYLALNGGVKADRELQSTHIMAVVNGIVTLITDLDKIKEDSKVEPGLAVLISSDKRNLLYNLKKAGFDMEESKAEFAAYGQEWDLQTAIHEFVMNALKDPAKKKALQEFLNIYNLGSLDFIEARGPLATPKESEAVIAATAKAKSQAKPAMVKDKEEIMKMTAEELVECVKDGRFSQKKIEKTLEKRDTKKLTEFIRLYMKYEDAKLEYEAAKAFEEFAKVFKEKINLIDKYNQEGNRPEMVKCVNSIFTVIDEHFITKEFGPNFKGSIRDTMTSLAAIKSYSYNKDTVSKLIEEARNAFAELEKLAKVGKLLSGIDKARVSSGIVDASRVIPLENLIDRLWNEDWTETVINISQGKKYEFTIDGKNYSVSVKMATASPGREGLPIVESGTEVIIYNLNMGEYINKYFGEKADVNFIAKAMFILKIADAVSRQIGYGALDKELAVRYILYHMQDEKAGRVLMDLWKGKAVKTYEERAEDEELGYTGGTFMTVCFTPQGAIKFRSENQLELIRKLAKGGPFTVNNLDTQARLVRLMNNKEHEFAANTRLAKEGEVLKGFNGETVRIAGMADTLVQEAVTPLDNAIFNLNREGRKKIFRDFVNMQLEMWRAGFFNVDPKILNYGIRKDGKIVVYDLDRIIALKAGPGNGLMNEISALDLKYFVEIFIVQNILLLTAMDDNGFTTGVFINPEDFIEAVRANPEMALILNRYEELKARGTEYINEASNSLRQILNKVAGVSVKEGEKPEDKGQKPGLERGPPSEEQAKKREEYTLNIAANTNNKDETFVVLVGVGSNMNSADVQPVLSEFNRQIARKGYGEIRDNKQLIKFVIDRNNAKATQENIDKILKDLPKGTKVIIFVPEMGGKDEPKLAGTYKDRPDTTVIPDAYTDYEYPDIVARYFLGRNIAVCDNEEKLKAINEFLMQVLENYSPIVTMDDLKNFLKNPIRFKPIYKAIEEWRRMQIATAQAA